MAASVAGFYVFRRRRNNGVAVASQVLAEPLRLETEEDKVIKVLRASGGSMRQSDITDALGFTKAKTSQLLATLEKSGSITRYKSGRDKIVNLTERVKEKK